MKVALFCHHGGQAADPDTLTGLRDQCCLLEHCAAKRAYIIEYTFFHTGAFDFHHPDIVLLHLLQYAQAKAFDLILVESKNCFPVHEADCIPPIQIFFLKEHVQLALGTSCAPVFQELPNFPKHAHIYLPKV